MDQIINFLRILDFEATTNIALHRTILDVPNQAAFQSMMYFVLNKLDPEKAKSTFRNCWPVVDGRGSAEFRKAVANFLANLPKEHSFQMPANLKSLLFSPHGPKFVAFFAYLTKFMVQVTLGYSTVYPVGGPNARVMRAAAAVKSREIERMEKEAAVEDKAFHECMTKHSNTLRTFETRNQLLKYEIEQLKKAKAKRPTSDPGVIKEKVKELRDLWNQFDRENEDWDRMWENVSCIPANEGNPTVLDGTKLAASAAKCTAISAQNASMFPVTDDDGNLDILNVVKMFKVVLNDILVTVNENPLRLHDRVLWLEEYSKNHLLVVEKLETLCSSLRVKSEDLLVKNKLLWARAKENASFDEERKVFSFPSSRCPPSRSEEERTRSFLEMSDMLRSALGIASVSPLESATCTPQTMKRTRRACSPLVNDPLAAPVCVKYKSSEMGDNCSTKEWSDSISCGDNSLLEIHETGRRQSTKVFRPRVGETTGGVTKESLQISIDKSNPTSIRPSRYNAVRQKAINCIVDAVLNDSDSDSTEPHDILEDPLKALDMGAFRSKDRLHRTPEGPVSSSTTLGLHQTLVSGSGPLSSKTSTPFPVLRLSLSPAPRPAPSPDVSRIMSSSSSVFTNFEAPTPHFTVPTTGLCCQSSLFPAGSPSAQPVASSTLENIASTDVGFFSMDMMGLLLETNNNNKDHLHESFCELETTRKNSLEVDPEVTCVTPMLCKNKNIATSDAYWSNNSNDDAICDEGGSFLVPVSPDVSTLLGD